MHFRQRGSRRELQAPASNASNARPRAARQMALAIRFEEYLRTGQVASYAELAGLGHVTRARISQIMNLLTDIREAILFLPRTKRGRDLIVCDRYNALP